MGGWFWLAVRRVLWGVGGMVCLLAIAGAGPVPPPERMLYGQVRGRVVDPDTGQPVPEVPVSLLYETTTTDTGGRFVFDKVPLVHTTEVSLRVKSRTGLVIGCITLDVPVRFYPVAVSAGDRFDMVIVDPGDPGEVILEPQPLAPGEVDGFCSNCHQNNPCLETATFEEVVKSGKDLRGIVVFEDEVEEKKKEFMLKGLRKSTYMRIRYQDTHPDGMDMSVICSLDFPEYKGRYRQPENLKLFDGRIVTCDTCHTRHMPTQYKQYVVMSYEEDNLLCLECHL